MKKLYITVLIAVCFSFLFSSSINAQSGAAQQRWFDRRKSLFLNQIGVSASISTVGIGVEAITPINEKFYLRAGIDYLPPIFKISDDIKVNDPYLYTKVGGYYPDYKVEFKPTMLQGHVLVNFYPWQFNNIYFVGGVYVGISEIKAEGYLVDPTTGARSVLIDPADEWPALTIKGEKLRIDDGRLDADIKMGLGKLIRPYLGVGYSTRPLPKYKNDFGLSFDAGVLIQGVTKIEQSGAKPTGTSYHSNSIDIDKYLNRVRVWPMLSMKVTFRVK